MTLHAMLDLFGRCRGKETGHWAIGDGHRRTLYLDSGDIVYASSTFPEDKLTAVLMDSEKLSRDQLDHAMANLKPGLSIGKNLIEMGFITQTDLLEAARLQVGRIVRSALAAAETPDFSERDELERGIVRLPLDTPFMLFVGIMWLPDRESVLEPLGPLNQVVLLQGKRVNELDIPEGLSGLHRAIPLMDGTHTILEMGGETKLDTMTLGAFALFLREMGWAKLFELPPLDRQALDEALTLPDPTKPPSSIPAPRSPLFDDIEKAGRQTTSLDHLAKLLDGIPAADGSIADDAPAPEDRPSTDAPDAPRAGDGGGEGGGDSAWMPESLLGPSRQGGPGSPGGLSDALESLEEGYAGHVGRVIIVPETESQEGEPWAPPIVIGEGDGPGEEQRSTKKPRPAKEPKSAKARGKPVNKMAILAVLAILGAIALAAVWKSLPGIKSRRPPFTLSLDGSHSQAPHQGTAVPPAQASPAAPRPAAQAAPQGALGPGKEAQVDREAPGKDAPAGADKQAVPPAPPPDTSVAARFAAVSRGNTPLALQQGKAYRDSLPESAWTIRLVVAQQGETLQNCARAFGGGSPDLFVMPIRLVDGRQCYQLFMGRFQSKAQAEAEAGRLPDIFNGRGMAPRVIRVGDISAVQ
jgi:hypothetical protein